MSAEGAPRKRPSGLGRGLSALLGEVAREQPVAPAEGERAGISLVPVASIIPHPDQPRRFFDDAALDELAASIRSRGVIQPIVVRAQGNAFQIVAGERRWRAAQRAQLHEVPVIVRSFDEAETLEIALLENIQREELNAIEEAEAYRRLMQEYGHTQEALGKLVHKSRSHIANLLRLLDLPAKVRTLVAEGKLSMGHGRAVASAEDPTLLAELAVEHDMSVREVEALARSSRPDAKPKRTPRQAAVAAAADADIAAIERQLAELIGVKVKIAHSGMAGTLTLSYSSFDQLDMLIQRLSGEPI